VGVKGALRSVTKPTILFYTTIARTDKRKRRPTTTTTTKGGVALLKELTLLMVNAKAGTVPGDLMTTLVETR
jgi:hypothetical protein